MYLIKDIYVYVERTILIEVSENLANLKIISLDHQNYYVRNLSIISKHAAKKFWYC